MQQTPSKKRFIKLAGIIIAAAVISVGAYAAFKPSSHHHHEHDEATPASQDTKQQPASTPQTTTDTSANVTTVNIEAGSYYFKPDKITVKKGTKVKIVLTAKGMTHDFVIDDLNVAIDRTSPGETNTTEFTADKVGSYEFYCSVSNHRSLGQVGTLVVTE